MTNKCATLRHGGRYGGSLSGQNKGSPSPNLKNTQPPSISTVSNEYSTRAPFNTATLQYNKKDKDNDGGGGGVATNKPQPTVYSIDASTPHVNFSKQSNKQNEMSNTGGPIKGISILNQPLPEIPQQQTQTLKMSDLNKNLQQPLSVTNLNQYRSLQRPSSKLSTSQMNSYQHHQQQQQLQQQQHHQQLQQQQHYQQQQQPQHSNKPSIQLPPKVNPPSLPPKNRQKDDMQQQQQPLPSRNNRQLHTGTLPSSRSQNLNQISNFNRENSGGGAGGGGGGILTNKSGAGSTTYSTFGYEKGQNINQMTTFDKPMTKNNGGFSYTDQGNTKQLNITKQGYQTLPHQHRNHHTNSTTNQQQQSQMQQGYVQQNNTTSFHSGKPPKNINKHHQQQDDVGMMSGGGGNKKDDPNLYYRSLQRGGTQANNDLYSVTEL